MITIEMNRLNEYGELPKKKQEVYMLLSKGGTWVRDWMKESMRLKSPEHRTVNDVRNTWIVPPSKARKAVEEALKKDNEVIVYQTFNKTTKCTSSCKAGKNRVEECVCQCMGKFHGHNSIVDKDGSKLQAVIQMPDFSLHVHGKYVHMRTEYLNGRVISKTILDDDGKWLDVTKEYQLAADPELTWAAKEKDKTSTSQDREYSFCEDVMLNRACSCGECSTYLADWD